MRTLEGTLLQSNLTCDAKPMQQTQERNAGLKILSIQTSFNFEVDCKDSAKFRDFLCGCDPSQNHTFSPSLQLFQFFKAAFSHFPSILPVSAIVKTFIAA